MNMHNRTLGIVLLAVSMNYALASTTTEPATGGANENANTAPGITLVKPESAPADKPAEVKFGEGMQIPVDGTSLEAFEQSLATIKTKTTQAEYTTLTNAIDYLMVYYIDARRDRTKLAALLNGKTGEQIVGKVAWDK